MEYRICMRGHLSVIHRPNLLGAVGHGPSSDISGLKPPSSMLTTTMGGRYFHSTWGWEPGREEGGVRGHKR